MPTEVQENRKFNYLLQLYKAMEKESTVTVTKKKGAKSITTYEGKVVTTFHSLGISMTHYSVLFNALKELGCIELVDRGVRGRPTRYRLHGAPTEDAYDARYVKGDKSLTRGAKPATIPLDELEQRITNLEGRLKGLDIKGVVLNHEERLGKLEKVKGGST